MVRRTIWATCLVAATIALAGCGGGGLETVSGKVTLDGAPLAGARVTLAPQNVGNDPKKNLPLVGATDDLGMFTIGPIGDPGGGAPAGLYRLAITTAHTTDTRDNAVLPPERVPAPYPSGVDFDVPAGGTDAANFDLTSK
jgi:hypothetical protein